MFDTELPRFLDPRKLCDGQQTITGQVDLSTLAGFCSYLQSDQGQVDVQLHFSRDNAHRPIIRGKAEVKGVQIGCQRCLDAISIDIIGDMNVAIVLNEEQAQKLPIEYDPWLLEDKKLDMREFIDHEMILNIPIVAYHSDCEIATEFGQEETVQEKPNPFEGLQALLQKD
ncbi:MAG: DUF177 domain-containing protein [Oceanospirillaceae bacterium]|nr:DUF177 domain-containing protein [Oceanospirillaceae bacterium]